MPRWQLTLGVRPSARGPRATLARPQAPPSAEKTQRCPTFPGANRFVQTIDTDSYHWSPVRPSSTGRRRTARPIVMWSPSRTPDEDHLGVETVVVRDTAGLARRPRRGHAGLVRPGQRPATSGTSGKTPKSTKTRQRPREHRGLIGKRGSRARKPGIVMATGEPAPWPYRQECAARGRSGRGRGARCCASVRCRGGRALVRTRT